MLADAAERQREHELEPAPADVLELDDVDADGIAERVVVSEAHCGVSGNCPRIVYLSQKGCTHFAGIVWAAELELLPSSRHGVRDLRTYLKDGCAGMAGQLDTLVFDGASYARAGRITCSCPEDAPSSPRDPACPSY